MRHMTVEEVLEELKIRHPDKMLVDDFPTFQRGKEAGYIEIIMEIEAMLNQDEHEDEEEDDEDGDR